MLSTDEDALACDLMETYHIADMTELPVPLWARLAHGLRDDSRIRMAISGRKLTTHETLEAIIADRLGRLFWLESGNARAGKAAPESILDMLNGKVKQENNSELRTYETPEDFMRAWNEVTGNGDRTG